MTKDRDKLDLRWRRDNLLAGLALTGLCSTLLLCGLLGSGGGLSARASQSGDDYALPVRPDNVRAAMLRLDPNTASPAAMELLPGVGPTMAKKIVAARVAAREAGSDRPFKHLSDLDHIDRVGPAQLQKLAPYLDLPE